MSHLSTTEKFVRFGTAVETVAEAFTFVMSHLDEVGEAPEVEIHPCWGHDGDTAGQPHFNVSVAGVVT